ncbi:hypothetical protein CANARDRAFT_182004, partial [[Candida] arabinofermentans NRRL YB-2248]
MSLEYKNYCKGGVLNSRYVKVSSISEGSFGVVSLAKDLEKDRLVALKYNTAYSNDFISNSSKNADEGTKVSKSLILKETQQEINMLNRVSGHPNITELYDSFDTYIVMEYASRGDLHDAIQLGIVPVSTRDVIDVFMQLVSAVEYCHNSGVYHRDIKPENILISEDWSIKLTDFGLATDEVYCTDFDVGSERYMSPELLEHKGIDTYRADKVDIWSMGICLLNITFGKNPFNSASSKDKLFLHFAANREVLFDIFPSMSYDLFAALRYSLTIDPGNRDLELMKENLLKIEHLTCDFDLEDDDAEVIEEAEEESLSVKEQFATSSDKENEVTIDVKQVATAVPDIVVSKIPSLPKPRARGQRKPLKIPNVQNNYKQRSSNGRVNRRHYNINIGGNQHSRNHSSGALRSSDEPFKRADFFTPKSVFNHYMDKVYKNRQQNDNTDNKPYQHHSYQKGRPWMKRKQHRIPNQHYSSNSSAVHKDNYKSRNSFKKGSYMSKKGSASGNNRHTNTHTPTSSGGSKKALGAIGTPGKYIPPNLRHSPKSLENAMESDDEFNRHNRDDDDLFEMEDLNQGSQSHTDLSQQFASTSLDNKTYNSTFMAPFMGGITSNETGSNANALNSRDTSITTTFSNNLSSTGSNITNVSTVSKYIPPHQRRNSHSAVLQNSGTGILKKSANLSMMPFPPAQNLNAPSKQVRIITPSVSTSVPTTKTNWFNNHISHHSTNLNSSAVSSINWFDLENADDMDMLFDDDDVVAVGSEENNRG